MHRKVNTPSIMRFTGGIMQSKWNRRHTAFRVDVMSLVVSIPGPNALKSKSTQHSCKELLFIGIQPDAIVCRADQPIPEDIRNKISLFCNIRRCDFQPQRTNTL